jgi:hypothetical protein
LLGCTIVNINEEKTIFIFDPNLLYFGTPPLMRQKSRNKGVVTAGNFFGKN